MRSRIIFSWMLVLISAVPTIADWGDPDPDGVFTISPVLDRSCVAVRVPVKATHAISGFRWWNNDAAADFPKVLVASGLNDVPPAYTDGLVVGENVGGGESAWSDWFMAEPLASDTGTLYIIFQLPALTEGTEIGNGPGFGYVPTETGSTVWVSSDGDDWLRLVTGYQLLVEPVYTLRDENTLALKCSRPDEEFAEEPTQDAPRADITKTELLVPYPNPFNPSTTVAFTLLERDYVAIDIFDVRGRHVKGILGEVRSRGLHEVLWRGDDERGQRVGSGVYFARMRFCGTDQIQRMTLLK